ncbi:MAG: 2-dehydro-3-deoxygalactonokinase [Sphingomonadaceae bacterium]|nr:2-dehydro-3-deoxygalactonokinase [Sphingomonadaceae bacterium]
MWRDKYIAVDWGTTNRRAWLVDRNGTTVDRFADHLGLMTVSPGGFDKAAADIRLKLGDHPMLLAGMVGSDKGWRNVPYVPVPADLPSLAAAILWIDARTGIIPGICQTGSCPDVMRGEEMQALGALANGDAAPDALVCHPGTHAKWIRLQHSKITQFSTMMTGEIFSLIRDHSILAAQLADEVTDGASFEAGLQEACNGASLLSSLFAIRARKLLRQKPSANASFASGLLIGSDVHTGLSNARPGEMVAIIGRSDLSQLYASAIRKAGFDHKIIDGDKSFLSGIGSITQILEPQ